MFNARNLLLILVSARLVSIKIHRFYKAIQSAGGAISWRIDAIGTHYLYQLIICWSLLAASIPGALIVAMSIKETNYDTKDVKAIDNQAAAENGEKIG